MQLTTPAATIFGKFKLLSVEAFLAQPEPSWLIEGLVAEGHFGVVYGQPGTGKSFVALDMALSVATGAPFHGKTVKKGPVVFVVAEGSRGVIKRVRAWMNHYDIEAVPDAFFVVEAPQLHRPDDIYSFRQEIAKAGVKPSLIIVDTLARCFVGGEENSAKDVGEWIAGMDSLRKDTGAAVLAVHHAGKNTSEAERGSSALRGAADCMFLVGRGASPKHLQVANNKQKDYDEATSLSFKLEIVSTGVGADTSCVLVDTEVGAEGVDLVQADIDALKVLNDKGPLQTGPWREACGPGISSSTFEKRRSRLLKRGYIVPADTFKNAYEVTQKGKDAIGGPAADQGPVPTPPTTATPLQGGQVEGDGVEDEKAVSHGN